MTMNIRGHDDVDVFVDGMDQFGNVVHWTALINHSFAENVQVCHDGTLVVLRKINSGEELFINYGMAYWKSALPELDGFPEDEIKQFLTPNPMKKDKSVWETARMKLGMRLRSHRKMTVEQLWVNLADRTNKLITFRQRQSDADRGRVYEKDAKFRESIQVKPKSIASIRKEIARKEAAKYRKSIKPFGSKRRKRRQSDAASSLLSLSSKHSQQSESEDKQYSSQQPLTQQSQHATQPNTCQKDEKEEKHEELLLQQEREDPQEIQITKEQSQIKTRLVEKKDKNCGRKRKMIVRCGNKPGVVHTKEFWRKYWRGFYDNSNEAAFELYSQLNQKEQQEVDLARDLILCRKQETSSHDILQCWTGFVKCIYDYGVKHCKKSKAFGEGITIWQKHHKLISSN